MAVDFRKYQDSLEKLKAAKMHELIHDDERSKVGFSPEDDIGMKHEMIVPESIAEINNKNMRMANLNDIELMAVKKGSMLITWLDGLRGKEGMDSVELDEFVREVKRDVNIVLNASVSRKGWLLTSILSPIKRLTLGGEIGERKSVFNRDKGGQ